MYGKTENTETMKTMTIFSGAVILSSFCQICSCWVDDPNGSADDLYDSEDYEELELVKNATDTLNELLSEMSYDPNLRPNYKGGPITVLVNIYVRSMGPISESDMTYSFECYFRQLWTDERLQYSGPLKSLPLNFVSLDRIWKPDTYFLNGHRSYVHKITGPNKLLRISPEGRVLYSVRITVKARCRMELSTFPMDLQRCPLALTSYAYPESDLVYRWSSNTSSVVSAPDMKLSQFDLIAMPHNFHTSELGDHSFSTLSVSFYLQRRIGHFLINVYVPCSMLVILSWVSFWINREATADRISLGVMTVLTMIFLVIDSRSEMPKVSYSTAIDWYVICCLIFILSSVLEFALVHFFTKLGSGEFYPMKQLEEPVSEELDETTTSASETEPDAAAESETRDRLTLPAAARPGVSAQRVRKRRLLLPNGEYPAAGADEAQLSDSERWMQPVSDGRGGRHSSKVIRNCMRCLVDAKRETFTDGHYNSVSDIDRASRIIFPLCFGVLNLIYFISYLGGRFIAIQQIDNFELTQATHSLLYQ